MKGEYRDANSLSEIESIIKETDYRDCVVWQNQHSKRVIYDLDGLKLLDEQRLVRLKLKNYLHDFDPNQMVYLKLNYRESMFKTVIERIEGKYVFIKLPKANDIKTIELRSEPRTSVDLNQEILITLSIMKGNSTYNQHVLRFQLVDISNSGICLLISNQNKIFIEQSDELMITHLGSVELKRPIKINMQYMLDYRYKKQGKNIFSNRAGFKLDEKFLEEELGEFLKSC
jgi:hypothetical protein